MTFQEFINMGGYGFYVWSSYLLSVAVFVGLYISLKNQRSKLIKQITREHRQIESK